MTAILAVIVVVIVAAAAVFMLTGNNNNNGNGEDAPVVTTVTVSVPTGEVSYDEVSSAIEQIKNSSSCNTLEVKFPATLTANMSTDVTVKSAVVSNLVAAEGSLTISTNSGSVTLDKATLAGFGNKDLKITVGISKDNSIATSILGLDYDEASAAVTVTIVAGSTVSKLSGKATVSVPYTLKSGDNASKVEIWYKESDGTLVEYPASYENGRVSFTVDHFSTFFVAFMTLKEAKTDSINVNFQFNNQIRLAIFGNVNGDDYINEDDYKLLESILKRKTAYDPVQHAFADVNNDGVLNIDDLSALRDVVDRKECKLYYWDAASKIASINYPLTGKIATYHVYPLDACIILGLYDNVVGMSNQGYLNSIGKDPSRYPGINDKIKNIGTPHEDPEALLATGADYYLIPWSYDNSKIESAIKSDNLSLQIVQLPMSKNGPSIVDQYGALLMLGFMTQTEDKAYEYISFVDTIQDDINKAVSKISERYTYITPFFSSSASTFKLDSPYKNGSMPGDCYTIQKLPMDSANLVVESGCPEVSVEWLTATNPDVIILILFHDYTYSVDDIQKQFEETVEYLRYTDAYANKMIFGVNYYNIANYAGIPTLPLLASYIWPELFDTEDSMAALQTYYEKYTAYDNPNVASMGNAIVYRMPVEETTEVPVEFEFNNQTRLAIFGNANGDDYIDEDDYKLLVKLVKGTVKYNPARHSFADVNADGVLNSADLDALRDIIDRKECKLYYWDAASKIASINYPLTGNIATYHVYPLDACIILGLYDNVVGMSNQGYLNSIGKDPSRYPGINDKIKNIGTPHEDPEALLATGADYYLIPWSYDNSKIESAIKSGNLGLQIVQLPMSKNGPSIVDQYGALLMLGFMTQTEDKAYEYISFVDKIQEDINSAVAQISERYTYITPFYSSSASTFKLDSPYKNGSMPGDCYTIQKLPMDSANLVVESGCPEVSVEWLTTNNPDVIVLIMFHDYKYSVEDIQKEFDEIVENLKYTDAYANKMIVGVNYYNIANYAGIPTLPLLASYIWPELFDTDECMATLQTYYEKYTAYVNPDVASMGNAIVYRMTPEITGEVAVDFEFNNEIRLAIFGNANGDDYLNEDDYKLLEKLITGTVKYDVTKHAFADVNVDGVLNSDDLVALRTLLNKEEGKMYYWDAASKIASINYPLTGKIATYHVYPLDACIILGLYDNVVGMSNQGYLNSIGKDPSRYPGINDKIKNIGTPHEDPEALLATGADYYLIPWSYDNSKIESAINSDNLSLQIVQLPMSKNGPTIVDQYGALLMLGVMTQTEERAYEYISFVDKIQDDINDAVAQISERYTYITPFYSSSASTFKLDSPYKNGSMPGDCYTIQKLPMDSANLVVESGCPEVSVEWLMTNNPDVIILILFHDYTYSVDDIQKQFNETVEYLKYTDAYANKMIFGVNYYNIANYAGIPTLPLLASYIWPELFDTDDSMAALQTYYEKYTAYVNPDVANMGNAIVYRMA